ncbi:MAG: glycosyltransferase family 39 protein [Acidobacteria bacterium]|nr:glycosyltransferase family 39 protein [Acidobacteriota bacterium]MBI3421580.1 glycosyltransferase family 39 protein [Acidobacteriota bacterium]
MVETGDWVTPRLNGIAYFEKPALRFWLVAVSYLIFGVHDWAARLPLVLAAIALCWLVRRMGHWAVGDGARDAGTLAGIVLATCLGLFLFTRILIPDVVLTLTTTLAMWALLRALDWDEAWPRLWATVLAISLGLGFMLKGLVAFVFPVGAGLLYLALNKRLFDWPTLKRLAPLSGILIILLICAPWVIAATLRNPPYFDFTLKSEPGVYHGFFWFFFLNEHLFRYLNLRYPRDYNTVPRPLFWLYHLLWLFPWSVYLPFVGRLNFKPDTRTGRVHLFCLCWIGWTLLFFTFSTTQEYYSMPCYPAFALLLGSVLRRDEARYTWAARTAGAVALLAALGCLTMLWLVRGVAAAGDIANAMNYGVSTLSLGKAQDLTLQTMGWLRVPLAVAFGAFLVGALGAWLSKGRTAIAALAIMMLLFFNAARLALVTLNPYFGSRPLAEALQAAPPGQLIVDDQYYAFSSVFFYSNRSALLLNGRTMNLEYGSAAPGAPPVFITDADLPGLWRKPERQYLAVSASAMPRLKHVLGDVPLHLVMAAGGKLLLTNQ